MFTSSQEQLITEKIQTKTNLKAQKAFAHALINGVCDIPSVASHHMMFYLYF